MPPDDDAPSTVTYLIPAAIQRRIAERVAALRDEIDALIADHAKDIAALPTDQEPRP